MEPSRPDSQHQIALKALSNKAVPIANLLSPYLSTTQLVEQGIIASEVNLEELELQPQYFKPASSDTLVSLAHLRPAFRTPLPLDHWAYNILQDDGSEPRARLHHDQATSKGRALLKQLKGNGEGRLIDTTSWQFKGIWGDLESSCNRYWDEGLDEYRQEWELHSVLRLIEDYRPHTACVLMNGVEDIGPILQSEVLTLICVIAEKMKLKVSERHFIFPAIMISMIGTKGRIIQGHYDGDKLYIQYSKLYEFKDLEKANVDLFLRWMMTEPVGDTSILLPRDDHDLDATHKSPSKKIGIKLGGRGGVSVGA